VAVGVVEPFEVVEVEDREGEGAAVSGRVGDQADVLLLEAPPVQQPGQRGWLDRLAEEGIRSQGVTLGLHRGVLEHAEDRDRHVFGGRSASELHQEVPAVGPVEAEVQEHQHDLVIPQQPLGGAAIPGDQDLAPRPRESGPSELVHAGVVVDDQDAPGTGLKLSPLGGEERDEGLDATPQLVLRRLLDRLGRLADRREPVRRSRASSGPRSAR